MLGDRHHRSIVARNDKDHENVVLARTSMAYPGKQPKGLWLCFLLLISHFLHLSSAITYLRTARVDILDSSDDWMEQPGGRQLLGSRSTEDARWGVLGGKVQLLVQIGRSVEQQMALKAELHAEKAIICGYLPENTWLVLARPDNLHSPAHKTLLLLPYLPEYKIAPEWHAVLDLVHEQQQEWIDLSHSSVAAQHLQLHQRIIDHEMVQQLQLHHPAASVSSHSTEAADAVTEELMHRRCSKLVIGVHFPDVPQSELRQAGDHSRYNPAAAAVADWQHQLAGVVAADGRCEYHLRMCQPELMARGRLELDVAVCPQDLSEVLYWLSIQAAVHWLAPRPRLFLQNSVASMIVQDNGISPQLDFSQPEAHPFWGVGLDGRNQIIGIGDSGIDMGSCYFQDPANPFSIPANSDTWSNPNHRKVVMYWGLADDKFRDLVGHGTHTSGSLAGFNPADPTSRATGSAKGARLAFADLSRTSSGDVNAPQDVAQNYYPKLYEAGARIFSDSWGSTSPVYDFQSSRVDAWLYEHQDTISHFAAGNYGENDNLDTTITSPATAKNVVTVGATKSLTPNYISQTIAPVFQINIKILRAGKAEQYISVRLVKAEFGGEGANLSKQGLRMVRADPPDACSSLNGDYKNAIVLARRGQCLFSVKMAGGTAAGAAAVVIVNDRGGGYFKMDAQAQDSGVQSATIALLALPRRMGEELWALFDNADTITATITRYTDTWEAYEDIAAFSSFGPTADGRTKPDIVCPGELVSASSSDNDPSNPGDTCNVGRKSGTSMATPMVAGHATLIRQYFIDGFYPSGAAAPSDSYTPSGPLIKAVMLGGACDMKGNTEQYLPLEESPSIRQGYGRLCLCTSLKLSGRCNIHLQVLDRVPITSQDTHKYCLQTAGAGDVRVMLTWFDPPAQLSAETTLVNNLDLTVKSAGMGGQKLYGNHGQTADTLNNVERVWLKNPPAGGLEISVTATINAVGDVSQNYSLVVQGSFDGVLAGPYNPDKSAHSLSPGPCNAAQMLSVDQPAMAAAPAASVAPATALAATTVQTEAASASGATTAATPAPALPVPVATSPPAAPPANPATPPATPGPPSSSALINALIGAMQTPPPAAVAQDVTTTAGTGITQQPDVTVQPATDALPGRRLSWLPDSLVGVSVRVPALVCHWLGASGINQRGLLAHMAVDPQGGRTMQLPLTGVAAFVISCTVVAVLVLLHAAKKHKLVRSSSLTSAVGADLSNNRVRAVQQASDQLTEALLQDPSLAADLTAAAQQQQEQEQEQSKKTHQPQISESHSIGSFATTLSLDVTVSGAVTMGSSSDPGSPVSPATVFAAVPWTTALDGSCSVGWGEQQQQQDRLFLLPSSHSCPVPSARPAIAGHQLSFSSSAESAPAATKTTAVAAPGNPLHSFVAPWDQQQNDMLLLASARLATAADMQARKNRFDVLQRGSRSLCERPPCYSMRRVRSQLQQEGSNSVGSSSDSVTVPLPESASTGPEQQQQDRTLLQPQQQTYVQRSRSYSSAFPLFKGRTKDEQQLQQIHVVHRGVDG